MKKSSKFLLAGACAAGLATGLAGKRMFVVRGSSGTAVAGSSSALPGGAPDFDGTSAEVAASAKKNNAKDVGQQRSPDKLETLVAIEDGTLYSRLAVWLMDASEEEIAAYWQAYQKKDRSKRSRDIHDLVFLNWARLNPQGAIAGAGPGNEQYAWWAWACHDPKASLAAAITAGGDRLNDVAFGLGEFHPEWLRENFKQLPEESRLNALTGLMKWDDGQNPLETLRFMQKHGVNPTSGNIKALARKDPAAAIAWAKDYQNMGSDMLSFVARTLAAESPADLQRLAAEAPSGEAKLKMEAALFSNLVKTDPAAALEQARATSAPRVAAERYAALGLSVVKSDPEQAFALAGDLFTKCPDAMKLMSRMDLPTSNPVDFIHLPGVNDLAERLLAKDPARTLEMALAIPAKGTGEMLRIFSDRWATQDLAAYTEWVNQQSDRAARDTGAAIISQNLSSKGHFAEAAEWAMSGPADTGTLNQVMSRWASTDSEAASRWLESSSLPESAKSAFKDLLERRE